MNTSRSESLFSRAQGVIPGGVNSPVRAFRSVGGTPRFIVRGEGSHIWDADGNEYIDFVGSWGPLLLGHRHPLVIEALRQVLEEGTSYGAPTEREIELAEAIRQAVPSMEMVRLVNSGTEATMSALRLARGFTGRDLSIKFEGCYHGHADCLLVKAGSGALTFGNPDSAGVPTDFAKHTLVLPFNDVEAVKATFAANPNEIAAIILEPVPGNAGLYLPRPGYLEFLREITRAHGTVLIFDEVMTGFRLAPGGAQERFGLTPDVSTFGKIIGGGLPVGAFGGRADIMDCLAPLGPVYQAGTLSGNPLAMAAGIAMLGLIRDQNPYPRLDAMGAKLADGFRSAAASAGIPVQINRVGSMLTAFLTSTPVVDLASATSSDTAKFGRWFHGMLNRGVYLPCSQFEAMFVSAVHSDEDIAATLTSAKAAFADLNG